MRSGRQVLAGVFFSEVISDAGVAVAGVVVFADAGVANAVGANARVLGRHRGRVLRRIYGAVVGGVLRGSENGEGGKGADGPRCAGLGAWGECMRRWGPRAGLGGRTRRPSWRGGVKPGRGGWGMGEGDRDIEAGEAARRRRRRGRGGGGGGEAGRKDDDSGRGEENEGGDVTLDGSSGVVVVFYCVSVGGRGLWRRVVEYCSCWCSKYGTLYGYGVLYCSALVQSMR